MRNTLFIAIASICLFLLSANKTFATHLYGGDLLYTHIGGNDYRLKLTLYGDCDGQSYPLLMRAVPQVLVYNNGIFIDTLLLTLDTTSIKEITPVCPAEANNTACKGGTLPGITQYEFYITYTVPSASANWQFVFNGSLSGGQSAGRSNNIGNLSTPGTLSLRATLNNTAGPNSSPAFTSLPTPFFCINTMQEYNIGATDTNNDSLYFSLYTALNNNLPMTYRAGYSSLKPVAVVDSTYNFNNLNGQMTFMPDMAQTSVVVNKVDEYKNGVLVGSSMREMTFIVFPNCNNTAPDGKIDTANVINAGIDNTNIYTCIGTEYIAFPIATKDKDGDNVTVGNYTLPSGAGIAISNNGSTTPLINFAWNIKGIPVGIYNIYINLRDDGCPLSSNQTVAYTVHIVPDFVISHKVLSPTNCYGKQYTEITVSGGSAKKTVTVHKGFGVIKKYTDSATVTVIRDSFAAGEYTITAQAPANACSATVPMVVADSGTYPIKPFLRNMNLCVNDAKEALPETSIDNYPLIWYSMDGQKIQPYDLYNTQTPGTYYWQAKLQVNTCESIPDTFILTVHAPPVIDATTKGGTVCLGDTILLTATGGATYKWLPADKVFRTKDGGYATRVMQPGTYTAIGASIYLCEAADSVHFTNIENCCTFSYPNAFTPNKDGLNDGFKPIMYGNESEYFFAVYNRWGEQVFATRNPRLYWDGTYQGKLCDVGTYFFRVSAICLTGHREVAKGEVLLLR